MEKRGVSPVIATILLVALVIIIGLIVFFWMRGMLKESITKFDGKNIKLVCEELSFEAEYSGSTLSISNTGNAPIYSFDVKIEKLGSHSTKEMSDIFNDWDSYKGLNAGATFSGDSVNEFNDATKITLIPILMGVNKKGETKTDSCDERHGVEVFIS